MGKLWEGSRQTFPAGAKAFFYVGGTTTPLTVYAEASETTPLTNPVTADSKGRFPAVFVPYQTYGERVVTSTGEGIYDYDLIPNPAPPETGGGSGIVVTSDQIFQTGFPLFLETTGSLAGFVRDNGRTIGNAASGATERANDDTAALFTWYWNNHPTLTVSGGRGASASADFSANKTIATLDKRGYGPVGLDDMGNLAANRIQTSTTITTTNGSNSATVGSASNLARGMFIVSANVPAGTTITAISGTTITMSANASAPASGTAARFSFFSDAQIAGATGGSALWTLNDKELPLITPAGTISLTDPSYRTSFGSQQAASGVNFNALTSSGGVVDINAVKIGAGSATFNGTQFGGGLAHGNIPPGILGTWYRKL